MVRIVKRNNIDLEVAYRKMIGTVLWTVFGVVTLFQILSIKPFYFFGQDYYSLPFLLGALPLLIVYLVAMRSLDEEIENAPPSLFLSVLIFSSLVIGSYSYYSIEVVTKAEILKKETIAKNNLIELATFLRQIEKDFQLDKEDLYLDGNWNNKEFLPELPNKFRGHLNWVKLGEEAVITQNPIEGYHYYYRCSTLGLWHLWTAPVNYPYEGRMTFLMNKKGKMLSRDFYDKKITVKQFPSNKRQLKNYKELPAVVFDIQDDLEEDS